MEKLWMYLDRESEILSIQFDRPRNDAGVQDYPGEYGVYRHMKTGDLLGWLVFECISVPTRSLPLGFVKNSPHLDISYRRGRLRGVVGGDELFNIALPDTTPVTVKMHDFALADS